jgi:uncharacterized protein (TIRG00374 family)
MEPTKKPFIKNPIAVILIFGLIAFIVYVLFFIDPSQVLAILSQINPIYYAGAFVAYVFFTVFSALVWRRLLKNLTVEISARKALLYTWVGLFFEATIPQLGWSGEVSKIYLLFKDAKIDTGKIGASVVGQKIFVLTMTVVSLGVGLTSVLLSYPLPLTATVLIATVLSLSLTVLILVYYVSIKPSATKTLLNWGLRIAVFFRRSWNPENFKQKAEDMLNRFHTNINQLKTNPKRLILPIVYSVLSFICEVSVVFLSFIALGYPVPVDKVLIVFTLTGTLQSVGVTFFGFPEIIMSASFSALGIPVPLSFSVTLLSRIVTLWFRLIVSYIAFQWVGIKILRNQQTQSQPTVR